MRIVEIKTLTASDRRKGLRVGQIGTVVDIIENGALLIDIPKIGMVMLFTEQIKDVKDA